MSQPPLYGMQRHWQVSKQTLKIWRLLSKGNDEQAAHLLKNTLGFLKGPLLKMGQITAMVPGLLPATFTEMLEELWNQAPPMGWPFVKRRLASELGPRWENHFKDFSPQASFSASLGQVHSCHLTDGQQVACKIQYPGMDRVLETDMLQVRLLFRLYERVAKAIDTTLLQKELYQRLLEELDYHKELHHMKIFKKIFLNHPHIHIPTPFEELSTKRLITMTWMEGKPMSEAALYLDQDERNRLGALLLKAWYTPFYHYGILHGDPHGGNVTWFKGKDTQDFHINLLDFGCLRVFSPSFIQSVILLYEAILHNQPEKTMEAYLQWGFHDLNKELIDALNLWASFLFKPFLQDKITNLQEISSVEQGKKVALTIHHLLAQNGGIQPPSEFLIMDRVAVVLGSHLIRLNAQQNWYHLFQTLISSFSFDNCTENQKSILA